VHIRTRAHNICEKRDVTDDLVHENQALLNHGMKFYVLKSKTPYTLCVSARQSLQRFEPQRQIPTEGNPPSVLAPQRAALPLREIIHPANMQRRKSLDSQASNSEQTSQILLPSDLFVQRGISCLEEATTHHSQLNCDSLNFGIML
jgi:hypothetical protein